jgi:hypothetical protein
MATTRQLMALFQRRMPVLGSRKRVKEKFYATESLFRLERFILAVCDFSFDFHFVNASRRVTTCTGVKPFAREVVSAASYTFSDAERDLRNFRNHGIARSSRFSLVINFTPHSNLHGAPITLSSLLATRSGGGCGDLGSESSLMRYGFRAR